MHSLTSARTLFVHLFQVTYHEAEAAISFRPPLPPTRGSRLYLARGTCPLGMVDETLRQLEIERGVTLRPGNTNGPFKRPSDTNWIGPCKTPDLFWVTRYPLGLVKSVAA